MENIARSVRSQFDSDSKPLMLDDGASASITNDLNDIIHPPKQVNHKVRGIKGHANGTHLGMICWHIEDDMGRMHAIVINSTYLIPDAPARILSPQHLAQ